MRSARILARFGSAAILAIAGGIFSGGDSFAVANDSPVVKPAARAGSHGRLLASGSQIRNRLSGRCLDADLNGGGRNGTKIQLWDCNGQDQQYFYLDTTVLGWVRNYAFPRCMDMDNNFGGANGSAVQLWDCMNVTNQRWITAHNGEWTIQYNNKCLDADLNTIGQNGTKVQVWDCNGSPQQQWDVIS